MGLDHVMMCFSGYIVVVVDGVGIARVPEEFEMLRSLQPYLMCIAFGLTLLR
jgi:hypothetical protein